MEQSFEKSKIWGLPEKGPARRLLEIGAIWLIGSMLWIFFQENRSLGEILGVLLLPAILIPLARLLLHPGSLPSTPEEQRELVSSTIISYVSTFGVVLLALLISGGQAGWNPASMTILMISLPLLYLLTLQNRVVHLKSGSSGVAWFLIRGTIVLFLVSVFVRSDVPPEMVISIGFLLNGPPIFFRSLRNEWVVRLERGAKYRLLGLSFLGVLTSIGWLILLESQLFSWASDRNSPAENFLLLMAALSIILILSAQSGLFFRTLATLPTARMIDRRQQEIRSISDIGVMMAGEFDRDALLEKLIGTAAHVSTSELAWLRLASGGHADHTEGAPPYAKRPELAELIGQIERITVGDRTPLQETAQVVEEVSLYEVRGLQSTELPDDSLAGMVALVPLAIASDRIGTLWLYTSDDRGYDQDDRRVLETVAAQISVTLEHADLLERSLERERLQNEMEIAREAQQRLLPSRLPEVDGCTIAATSRPALMVGGDYYDTITFEDGSTGVLVADVAGKGAGAALYMSMVKGVVRGLNGRTPDCATFLGDINRSLYRHIDPRFFVTMTVARILPDQGMVEIARAGHTPALVVETEATDEERMTLLTPRGMGLALGPPSLFNATIAPIFRPMRAGTVIALFSDGLSEARGPERGDLGDDGCARLIAEVLGSAPERDLSDIIEEIIRKVSTFSGDAPQHDDITLLLIRREATPEPSHEQHTSEESTL